MDTTISILNTETARLFNSVITAFAVVPAFELGLFDELKTRRTIRLSEYAALNDLHAPSLASLFRALACFDIVRFSEDSGAVTPGEMFEDIYREKGYFLWLLKGYAELLQSLTELLKTAPDSNETGTVFLHRRNFEYIALAGKDYGSQFVDPYFEYMLSSSKFGQF